MDREDWADTTRAWVLNKKLTNCSWPRVAFTTPSNKWVSGTLQPKIKLNEVAGPGGHGPRLRALLDSSTGRACPRVATACVRVEKYRSVYLTV